VANIVKAYAERAGFDASTFSWHSLRAGVLPSAAGKGASNLQDEAGLEGPHSDDDAPLREVTPATPGVPVNFFDHVRPTMAQNTGKFVCYYRVSTGRQAVPASAWRRSARP
jgi:hypothetical protein